MEFRRQSVNTDESANLLNDFHIDVPEPSPSIFTPFQRLPTELRLKIWSLQIKPRIIHFNELAASRAKLKLDPSTPPILHTCQESRAEGLKVYQPVNIQKRRVYTHPNLDTLLWVRFHGALKFRDDALRLNSCPSIPFVQNYAISVKFWNRITTLPQYAELYMKFRTSESLRVLTIVDDEYGKLEWSRVEGCAVRLHRMKRGANFMVWEHCERGVWKKRSAEELWDKRDGGVKDPEGSLPEIKFARIGFCSSG